MARGGWWLLPYGALTLVMLHAMMELSVSLLAARAPSRRTPVAKADLLRRLRAIEDPDWPAPLTPGVDCDLEIHH